MPKIKISELDSSAALTGNEELPVVQTGTTFKTTIQDVADLAVPYKHYAVLLSFSELFPGEPAFYTGVTRINQIGDGSSDGVNDIEWTYVGGVITGSMTTGDVFQNNKLMVTVNPTLGSGNTPIIFNLSSNIDVTTDNTKLYITPINATNGSGLTSQAWNTVVDIKRFY